MIHVLLNLPDNPDIDARGLIFRSGMGLDSYFAELKLALCNVDEAHYELYRTFFNANGFNMVAISTEPTVDKVQFYPESNSVLLDSSRYHKAYEHAVYGDV